MSRVSCAPARHQFLLLFSNESEAYPVSSSIPYHSSVRLCPLVVDLARLLAEDSFEVPEDDRGAWRTGKVVQWREVGSKDEVLEGVGEEEGERRRQGESAEKVGVSDRRLKRARRRTGGTGLASMGAGERAVQSGRARTPSSTQRVW